MNGIPIEAMPIGSLVEFQMPMPGSEKQHGTIVAFKSDARSGPLLIIQKCLDVYHGQLLEVKLSPKPKTIHWSHVKRVLTYGDGEVFNSKHQALRIFKEYTSAFKQKLSDRVDVFYTESYVHNFLNSLLPNLMTVSDALKYDLYMYLWPELKQMKLEKFRDVELTGLTANTSKIKRWVRQNYNRYLIKSDNALLPHEQYSRYIDDDVSCRPDGSYLFAYGLTFKLAKIASRFNKRASYRVILSEEEATEYSKKGKLYQHTLFFSTYRFNGKDLAVTWHSDCPVHCIPSSYLERLHGWKESRCYYSVSSTEASFDPVKQMFYGLPEHPGFETIRLVPHWNFAEFFCSPDKVLDDWSEGMIEKL